MILLLTAVASVGFLMLTSVAGGDFERLAEPQMKRFGLGLVAKFVVAMIPIWFLRNIAAPIYAASVVLLLFVEFFGVVGMGAQRWIDIGSLRIQPSELAMVTIVMMLAAYYDWLDHRKVSQPRWIMIPAVIILIPAGLTLIQPDLGTAILMITGGALVMFVAGVSWGVIGNFFLFVAMNMSLVMGLAPIKGVPPPLVSYGRRDQSCLCPD